MRRVDGGLFGSGAQLERKRQHVSHCCPFQGRVGGEQCHGGGSPWATVVIVTAETPARARVFSKCGNIDRHDNRWNWVSNVVTGLETACGELVSARNLILAATKKSVLTTKRRVSPFLISYQCSLLTPSCHTPPLQRDVAPRWFKRTSPFLKGAHIPHDATPSYAFQHATSLPYLHRPPAAFDCYKLLRLLLLLLPCLDAQNKVSNIDLFVVATAIYEVSPSSVEPTNGEDIV